jgi:hypothetical protein
MGCPGTGSDGDRPGGVGPDPSRVRLVVGITVDQLRADILAENMDR